MFTTKFFLKICFAAITIYDVSVHGMPMAPNITSPLYEDLDYFFLSAPPNNYGPGNNRDSGFSNPTFLGPAFYNNFLSDVVPQAPSQQSRDYPDYSNLVSAVQPQSVSQQSRDYASQNYQDYGSPVYEDPFEKLKRDHSPPPPSPPAMAAQQTASPQTFFEPFPQVPQAPASPPGSNDDFDAISTAIRTVEDLYDLYPENYIDYAETMPFQEVAPPAPHLMQPRNKPVMSSSLDPQPNIVSTRQKKRQPGHLFPRHINPQPPLYGPASPPYGATINQYAALIQRLYNRQPNFQHSLDYIGSFPVGSPQLGDLSNLQPFGNINSGGYGQVPVPLPPIPNVPQVQRPYVRPSYGPTYNVHGGSRCRNLRKPRRCRRRPQKCCNYTVVSRRRK